jgi:hypothetical protein
MIKWFLNIFKKAIEIGIDGRCICSCSNKCPLGRTGISERCTVYELFKANIKIKKSKRLQIEPDIPRYKPTEIVYNQRYYPNEIRYEDKGLFELAKKRTGK